MIKIKINTTEFKKAIDKLRFVFTSSTGKSLFADIGKQTVETIYNRVKSGKGVVSDTVYPAQQKNLAKLTSEEYIKLRGRTPLGEFGSARFCNLTFTGQLLNAIKYKATNNGFSMFIDNNMRDDGKLTNARLADYISHDTYITRPFFALTAGEIRILQTKFRQALRGLLRKLGY